MCLEQKNKARKEVSDGEKRRLHEKWIRLTNPGQVLSKVPNMGSKGSFLSGLPSFMLWCSKSWALFHEWKLWNLELCDN